MNKINVGIISKVTSKTVNFEVTHPTIITKGFNDLGKMNFFTVGSYLGTRLIDGEIIILRCEEIINADKIIVVSSYIGVVDENIGKFSEGVHNFPLIKQNVFTLDKKIIDLAVEDKRKTIIGKYLYDEKINISYNPNVLFGKHLGVFGNTGSGKTCTITSLIQNYIRNFDANIKFIILDVNGEYKAAFNDEEMEYYSFSDLRFRHNILSMSEYGKLFKASEGIQYPALKDCINSLKTKNTNWKISELSPELENWINSNARDNYNKNQLFGYLRTMLLRIDLIKEDADLMNIIDNDECVDTIESIKKSNKKVHILNVNVSNDTLDVLLFLLFKKIYLEKIINNCFDSHLVLVLEEAHRYINNDSDSTRLGNYFIDRLSREGRKFGLGLIISSQVPSMLSYSIISQCNSVIMHKITNKRDNEYLRGILRMSSDIFFDQMNSLPKQYAIVCGEAFKNDVVVKVLNASPLPSSADPIID